MSSVTTSSVDRVPVKIRQSLRSRYKDPFGKIILDRFSTLNESDRVVNVEDLEGVLMLERTEIIEQLRLLSDPTGVGKFKTGRKGHSSRFEAYPYSLKELGQLAASLAQDQVIDQTANNSVASDTLDAKEIGTGSETQSLEHRFLLRSDYPVNMRLPMDLTDAEAHRLAEFVKALPFH